jgi:hypothetical protein
LVIANGVAVFAFRGTGNDFVRDTVIIPTGVMIARRRSQILGVQL